MTGAQKQVSVKKTILKVLLYFVVLDVCVITLYPYFAMLCTALKSRVEIFSAEGTILPITALWSNFIDIWGRAPMGRYLLNSVLVAGGSTIIAMLCGIPAAYALARMKFHHRFPDVRPGGPAHRYLPGDADPGSYRQHLGAYLHQRGI